MNRRIAKFNIPAPRASGRFDLTMPEGAELLGVGIEAGAAVVWALVDPDAPTEQRRFLAAHTGDTLPNFAGEAPFLGTAISSGGVIWHVWSGKGRPLTRKRITKLTRGRVSGLFYARRRAIMTENPDAVEYVEDLPLDDPPPEDGDDQAVAPEGEDDG